MHEGFGAMSVADFEKLRKELQLNKALEAGHAVPGYEGGGSGAALIPQDLEGTLAAMRVPTEKQIKLWWRIFKDKAFNTVVEYTRVTSLGDDLDGFINELGLPATSNSEYERAYEKVKYLAVLRLVSDVMSAVKVVASPNALAEASQRALQSLLVKTEMALFFGNTNVNGYAWKGMIQAAEEAENVKDLRGQPLTPDEMEDAIGDLVDAPNYGAPEAVYMPYFAQVTLQQIGGANLRYIPGAGASQNQVVMGVRPNGILAPNGEVVRFEPHAFLKPEGAPPDTSVGDEAPATPTATAATASDSASKFGSNDAGTYRYKIVAVGMKGRRAAGSSSPFFLLFYFFRLFLQDRLKQIVRQKPSNLKLTTQKPRSSAP